MALNGINVLLGVSASVAAIRIPRLVRALRTRGANVKIVSTETAKVFMESEEPLPTDVDLFTDEHEWRDWKEKQDPVLHIELRKWATVFLVAPLSANTLAKLANGLCDNLLTCVARAWPVASKTRKPFLVAPAMNTLMWDHPITETHLKSLTSFNIKIIPPISKRLACGDVGIGAMEEPEKIVIALMSAVQSIRIVS